MNRLVRGRSRSTAAEVIPQLLPLAIVLALAACSGGAPAEVGPDSGASGDGGLAGSSGVTLVFTPQPAPGSSFARNGNMISVTSARFLVTDLRLIGDAAIGDSRTRKSLVDLSWAAPGSTVVGFDAAPPGLYSRSRGTIVSFSIQGQVQIGSSNPQPFEIEQDFGTLPFEFDLNESLDVASELSINVSVNLQQMVQDVPFPGLPFDEGRLEVEPGTAAMAEVEQKIASAFSVQVN